MCGSRQLLNLAAFVVTLLVYYRDVDAASGAIDLYLNNATLDDLQGRPIQNIAYYGVYYIGTPPRKFLGCFDTGSADTWVPSISCESSACRSHDQYDPSVTSTEQNSSQSTSRISYGTGDVLANLVSDTFSLAGINITNQGFGAAIALTPDFRATSCDGLVGLAFQTLSALQVAPPFSNAVSENALDQNLFSYWLSPDPGIEPSGQLAFGRTDPTKYSGQITYINIVREAYWQVPMGSVTVGGSNAGVAASTAIIDSGTTAIVTGDDDAAKINALIPGANYLEDLAAYNVSCNVGTLPNVSFSLGGTTFTVPPRLYVQALTDTAGNPAGVCVSAIVGGLSFGNSRGATLVLGTNFLRAYYTIFKARSGSTPSQVGFATGVGQPRTSSGGRRLSQDQPSLFTRPRDSLRNPKPWVPQRRLSETAHTSHPHQHQEGIFSQPAHTITQHKWGQAASSSSDGHTHTHS